MSVILILIPVSVLFAAAFLAAFIWAVRSGQYEDTCTPSMRLLLDDRTPSTHRPCPGASLPESTAAPNQNQTTPCP